MDETTGPELDADNSSPSHITDHVFVPSGEWYTRCMHCNMAQAAHAQSEIPNPKNNK